MTAGLLAGRFELLGRIGAGGLAEVWSARDRLGGAEVAVKVLHAHLAADAAVAERFRRELSVTRGLQHRGIVRVFELHEHEGRPFFTMELLQGTTLDRAGALPREEARRIAMEICLALQAAHAAGVVHRDLKPQNVFVMRDGAVKLLDFGLARVAGLARLTSMDAVPGTPGFIAPELLCGGSADARADLYALGATYFAMLTGRAPFQSSDPYGLPRLQRAGAPEDPRIGPEDAAILRRALDPDPERRFLDASQFLRALRGEAVPQALAAPPAIRAGGYDVLVHDVVRLRRGSPILGVLEKLGGQADLGWRLRLLAAGQAVLVSGASRQAADEAAAVCAEHGLPATVRPVSLRPRSEEWLARNGAWLLAALCGLTGALVAAVTDESGWIATGAACGYILSWGLRPPASEAPLAGAAGDAGIDRLTGGIARRTARLRAARMDEALLRDAEALAEQVRAAPDDALTHRLLAVAAALDDALARAA